MSRPTDNSKHQLLNEEQKAIVEKNIAEMRALLLKSKPIRTRMDLSALTDKQREDYRIFRRKGFSAKEALERLGSSKG